MAHPMFTSESAFSAGTTAPLPIRMVQLHAHQTEAVIQLAPLRQVRVHVVQTSYRLMEVLVLHLIVLPGILLQER